MKVFARLVMAIIGGAVGGTIGVKVFDNSYRPDPIAMLFAIGGGAWAGISLGFLITGDDSRTPPK